MAKKQSALGKNFYSIMDDNIMDMKEGAATTLRISEIEPRGDQPRKQFDREALEALADSIAAYGVLQPILVRPNPNFEGAYEIIAGERRWRAAKMAGLTEIPAMTFQTCVNLQSVVAQEGVTHIGANAFNGCSSLAELTLPAGLKSIGSAAFMNCCGLRTVYYGGDDTEWRAVSVHEYENSPLEHARKIFARE